MKYTIAIRIRYRIQTKAITSFAHDYNSLAASGLQDE